MWCVNETKHVYFQKHCLAYSMKTSTVIKINFNLLLDLNLPRRYISRHIWEGVSTEVYLRRPTLNVGGAMSWTRVPDSVEGKMEGAC